MASVTIHADGTIEVLEPPTPEEAAEAQLALDRVIRALARLAVDEDWLSAKGEPHSRKEVMPTPKPD